MANKKITQLPEVSTLRDEDLITAVDTTRSEGDRNVKISVGDAKTLFGGSQNLQEVTDGVGNNVTTNPIEIQNELTIGDGAEFEITLNDGANGSIGGDGGNLVISHDNVISLSADIVRLSGDRLVVNDDSDVVSISELKYNATTNVPPLANTDTTIAGFEIIVSTAGTHDFGNGAITFGVDDIIGNDGSVYYKKVDNNQSGGVTANNITNPVTSFDGDNEFYLRGTAILKNNSNPIQNDPMGWYYLQDGTHEVSFTNGISAVGNTIQLDYPRAKKVLSSSIGFDETWGRFNANIGASVGSNKTLINLYQNFVNGFDLVGNGTTTWTVNSSISNSSIVGTFQPDGSTTITGNYSGTSTTYNGFLKYAPALVYNGINNYYIEQEDTGSNYDAIKFFVKEKGTGNIITTPLTSGEKIEVVGYGSISNTVSVENWNTRGAFYNSFLGATTGNIWYNYDLELWFKVIAYSNTELLSKWQAKTGVTTYKLYRDVNEDFSTQTLIYAGTELQYLDTGLTESTLYYYRLDDQLDAEITRFKQRTKGLVVSPSDTPPVASNVVIAGSPQETGTTLTGTYDYFDSDGDPEAGSTFQWFRSDDISGTNEIGISGETSINYTLAVSDETKFIRFSVIPVNNASTGLETFSAYTSQIQAPSSGDLNTLLGSKLLIWLDDSSNNANLTQDGTNASVWLDSKTGGSNNAVQADGTKQPLLNADGLLFDGGNDVMRVPSVALSDFYMYFVVKPTTWLANKRVIDFNGSNLLRFAQGGATGDIRLFSFINSAQVDASGTVGVKNVYEALIDNANSTFNGTAVDIGGVPSITEIIIGNRDAETAGFNGSIQSIVVTTSDLTPTEKTGINDYLNSL